MKIGVVGLGTMGAGIAQLAVEAGLETVGREVTGDERYKNESLARYGAPEAEGASRDVPTEA